MKLEDLPEFTVAHISSNDDPFVLKGHFSKPHLVHRGDYWLRMPDGFPFWATVTRLDTSTGFATLESNDQLRPQLVVGATAPCVDAYWGSNEVNIILDPAHSWTKVVFAATDAFERPEPQGPTFGSQRVALDGRTWRPAVGQALPGERLVPAAWDHEHCLICFTAINPGDTAFVEPDGYWACSECYEKYVRQRDLGFLFPRS